MPGLLRGVARTAVIAGTATHVSNNVSRRQAARWNWAKNCSNFMTRVMLTRSRPFFSRFIKVLPLALELFWAAPS